MWSDPNLLRKEIFKNDRKLDCLEIKKHLYDNWLKEIKEKSLTILKATKKGTLLYTLQL